MNRLCIVACLMSMMAFSACNAPAALPPPPLSELPTSSAVPVLPTTLAITPTPVPFIPNVLRLTEPGCCVQPFWSADSRTVEFIDKPSGAEKSGIYGVSVDGGAVQLVSDLVGLPSPDGRYVAFLDQNGQTVVREVATGTDTVIRNDGQRPFISPASQRLAWAVVTPINVTIGSRVDISVANIDGSAARQLITVYGGGIAGWLDEDRLLVVGRGQVETPDLSLFSINVTTDEQVDIASEQRMRSVRVAPGGKYILYTVTLDPTNSANDGLWVISADGKQRYKLAVVGSAEWRDGSHLLVIPLEPDAPSHRLWQFDAASGQAASITDPAITSFRIAAGDWQVSPDGSLIVFLNADDQALWLMTLPPISSP